MRWRNLFHGTLFHVGSGEFRRQSQFVEIAVPYQQSYALRIPLLETYKCATKANVAGSLVDGVAAVDKTAFHVVVMAKV